MFSNKNKQAAKLNADDTREFNLIQNFTEICAKKCLSKQQIQDDLNITEKQCLGKCIDRSYDFLKITQHIKL